MVFYSLLDRMQAPQWSLGSIRGLIQFIQNREFANLRDGSEFA